MFADKLDYFLKMGGTFFNLLAAKFAFYEGVAAVAKVELGPQMPRPELT